MFRNDIKRTMNTFEICELKWDRDVDEAIDQSDEK